MLVSCNGKDQRNFGKETADEPMKIFMAVLDLVMVHVALSLCVYLDNVNLILSSKLKEP